MAQASLTTTEVEPATVYKPRYRDWTPEEKEKITKLYLDGVPMSAIGAQFGVTRGAIAGHIHRMGLTRGKSLSQQWHEREALKQKKVKEPPKLRVISGPRIVPQVKKRIRLKLVDSNTAVTLLELQAHHCRWPIGDPRHSDFRFCGCTRVSDSKNEPPYCAEHTRAAGRHYEKPD